MGRALILKAALLLCVFTLYTKAERTKADQQWILERLRERFYEFRQNTQYAALYVPPPNYPRHQMIYLPRPDWTQVENRVLYPRIVNGNISTYPHNYATASPDQNAYEYGEMIPGDRGTETIHTEDLFINLVLPRLEPWYHGNYNRIPRIIYLFTHFLPCANCATIIQNYAEQHPNTTIVVGYTNLFMGRQATIPAQRWETEQRRNTLMTFFQARGGRLIQLPTHVGGVCAQRGILRRTAKRAVLETCPAATKDREFIISMDFSNGKVVAIFAGLPPDYYGWLGLFNEQGYKITYEWTREKTAGRIEFDSYMNEDNLHVKYYRQRSVIPLISSFKWDNCGFDYRKLTFLPDNYGEIKIKLAVNGGYPKIYIALSNPNIINSNDMVILQSADQIGTHRYITYQYVTRMTNTNTAYERYYWSSSSFSSSTAKGIRAKYLRYSPWWAGYIWGGTYDNVTPLWTPEGCSGTMKP